MNKAKLHSNLSINNEASFVIGKLSQTNPQLNDPLVSCGDYGHVVSFLLHSSDKSVIHLRNASSQSDHAALHLSVRGVSLVRRQLRHYLRLLLVRSPSEELGQCGNTVKATWGRSRQQRKGFGKDRHLERRNKTKQKTLWVTREVILIQNELQNIFANFKFLLNWSFVP